MDAQLRKLMRNVDCRDPSSYVPAGVALVRSGARAEDLCQFLECILDAYQVPHERNEFDGDPETLRNLIFATYSAGRLRLTYRRSHRMATIHDGGLLLIHFPAVRSTSVRTTQSNFIEFLGRIAEPGRLQLAPPTSQFLEIIEKQILANGASECIARPLSSSSGFGSISSYRGGVFDVTTKVDPARDWRPDYHLRFMFARSPYRDFLEVSIEDNLWWGTEGEVQGMRITGTHHTYYGNAEPEYEDPDYPHSMYEFIENIENLPGLIDDIFQRFRDVIGR